MSQFKHEYPTIGRFQVEEFDYDSSDVYACITYEVGDQVPEGNYLLRDHDTLSLRCSASELGAMIQLLPEGEERDYLAATSQVVEALNLYNWGVREIIERAHSQGLIHSFNDPTANHAANYQKDLDGAVARLLNFGETSPGSFDPATPRL